MPARDPASVPAFLRRTAQPAARGRDGASPPAPAPSPRASFALPRPSTPAADGDDDPREPRLDPASLPMPSLSRRRVVTAAGLLLAGWLALSFAHQVGEATAAADRADDLRAQNAALRAEVATLQADVDRVQDWRFVALAGRAYGLGGPGEIPFALAADAPALPADAPGSAAVRLGAPPRSTSPLDAWLELLFGSAS